MKRRTLLKVFAALGGGAILAPSALYVASPGIKKLAEKIIYKELSYLKLDATGVTQFIEDYFKNTPESFTNSMRWKSYYYLGIHSKQSDNIFEMVRSYLLGSDFFQYKMDTKRTIKYIAPFDYYKSPVANPYSYIYQS